MGAPFVDWEAVRLAYISSVKSYQQVAREMGVSYSKIRAHGKDEDWPAQRVAYQREAAERAIASGIAQEADRLGKIINAANAMADVLEGVFEDGQQFHRHLVQVRQDKDEWPEERLFDKVDSRAIKDLTGALKDMTQVLRNLYNLPTQAEAEAQRIAAERLKLEQRRVDAESGTDKSIRVVLADGWEEMAK